MTIEDAIVSILILLGCTVLFISAIGIVRLPDVYCRSHALGKGMTLGISLLLLALWIHLGTERAGIKVPLAIAFQFATIPVASHLLTRVAYRTGIPAFKSGRPESIEKTAQKKAPGGEATPDAKS